MTTPTEADLEKARELLHAAVKWESKLIDIDIWQMQGIMDADGIATALAAERERGREAMFDKLQRMLAATMHDARRLP